MRSVIVKLVVSVRHEREREGSVLFLIKKRGRLHIRAVAKVLGDSYRTTGEGRKGSPAGRAHRYNRIY